MAPLWITQRVQLPRARLYEPNQPVSPENRLRVEAFDAVSSHCVLAPRRSSHLPWRKKLSLSFNFSFGINPPWAGLCNNILGNWRRSFQALHNLTSSPAAVPWSASVKATRIAERYAPRKNVGGDFITDALNLKIEIKSTRSKLTNPTLVARLMMTSSHTVGGTSSSTTSRNPSLSIRTLSSSVRCVKIRNSGLSAHDPQTPASPRRNLHDSPT